MSYKESSEVMKNKSKKFKGEDNHIHILGLKKIK